MASAVAPVEFSEVLAAVEHGVEAVVRRWVGGVEDSVDSEVDPQFGATALHWACHHNQPAIAKILLRHGANPNFPNAYQATPLHWACKAGSLPLVELLLFHKADVLARTSSGDRPVDIAMQVGASSVVDFLQTPWKPTAGSQPARGAAAVGSPSSTIGAAKQTMFPGSPTAMVTAADLADMEGTMAMVPTLQRSNAKLEVEAQVAHRSAEELRQELRGMQQRILPLESKARALEELQRRLEAVQREKVEVELQSRQTTADADARVRQVQLQAKQYQDQTQQLDALTARVAELERELRHSRSDAAQLQRRLEEAQQ
eukprot:RCo011392